MFRLILPVLQGIDLFCDSSANFELVQKVMVNTHLRDVRDIWLVIRRLRRGDGHHITHGGRGFPTEHVRHVARPVCT